MLKSFHNNYWLSDVNKRWPLYPFCYEVTEFIGKRFFNPSTADFVIFSAILSGEITYEIEDKIYHLSKNNLIIIPAFLCYSFRSTFGYHKEVLEVRGLQMSEISSLLGLDHPVMITEPEKFSKLFSLMRDAGQLLEDKEHGRMAQTLGKIYELMCQASLQTEERGIQKSPIVRDVALRLNSHFTEKILLNDIAASYGITLRTLERMFRQQYQMSVVDYRNSCRRIQAQYLLVHTELSIKEIGFQLGYGSPQHFCNDFKQGIGHSPSEYRRIRSYHE